MRRNVTPCADWRLYVIIDRAAALGRDLAELAASAIRGGADAIQLRDKAASARQLKEIGKRLLEVTRAMNVPLIINDRPDVARAVGADGVHLGQEDLSIDDARQMLGSGTLIGQSTHSLQQAVSAEIQGADYLALGPVFATPTKPDDEPVGLSSIREAVLRVQIPMVCIGGIEANTLGDVLAAGATCVAVVRAVCGAEDPQRAARQLKSALCRR